MDTIQMGIGFGLWQQGVPDAHTLVEYIDKAEAWDIDSVWLSDHMMGERAEVSIIPMMAAIAARTQRLKFGPSVMMLPLRHPIAVARDVATLDYLSGGRMIIAVGFGADEKEADACNVPRQRRGSMTPKVMLARSAVGTPEECRDMLQRFVEHGLPKFALWPACPPSPLMRQLEFYARDIIPHVESHNVPVAAS